MSASTFYILRHGSPLLEQTLCGKRTVYNQSIHLCPQLQHTNTKFKAVLLVVCSAWKKTASLKPHPVQLMSLDLCRVGSLFTSDKMTSSLVEESLMISFTKTQVLGKFISV
mmetsp:Transcript_51765/g.90306  ORF Transcript_51765/g.90306 Transcript_51765/m.90306 type:complete len:111 (-) Transcript_51765:182-514(-)